ncbi:hypothetical protein [Martelella mediterranea]|uniref:Uncharacterized protein n=1 Tax=Martelella mediterranea TaxID=293089 RepID=A0A4R3NPC7_9HYPH|nr:hypothetical protein [Martelella mediterranea]TCT37461.1 hypothetical protein EDC90_101838 [Martelella mediterranea]TCT37665.1 hypothetical protein EDC90_101755 [Martelella mediterranea]
MTCNCLEDIEAKLAERNTEIQTDIIFHYVDGVRPHIQTRQIETGRGKAKAVSMLASYCPFCGTKYIDKKPES